MSDLDTVLEAALAPFGADRIRETIATHCIEGDYNEEDFVGVYMLDDGMFLYISAWCDTSGWDCRSGGIYAIRSTMQQLLTDSITEDERYRLGLKLYGET